MKYDKKKYMQQRLKLKPTADTITDCIGLSKEGADQWIADLNDILNDILAPRESFTTGESICLVIDALPRKNDTALDAARILVGFMLGRLSRSSECVGDCDSRVSSEELFKMLRAVAGKKKFNDAKNPCVMDAMYA